MKYLQPSFAVGPVRGSRARESHDHTFGKCDPDTCRLCAETGLADAHREKQERESDRNIRSALTYPR